MPASAIDHIEIRWRKKSNLGAWTERSIPVNQTTFTLDQIERGMAYMIQARSVTATGVASAWVEVQRAVPGQETVPPAPISIGTLGVADGVQVFWSAPLNTLGSPWYTVEYSLDVAGAPSVWNVLCTIRGLTATHGTVDGSLYWYRVRAVNAEGNSSAFVTTTTSTKAKSVTDGADISIRPTYYYDFSASSDATWALSNCNGANQEYATIRQYSAVAASAKLTKSGLSIAPGASYIIAARVKWVSGTLAISGNKIRLTASSYDGVGASYVAASCDSASLVQGVWTTVLFDMRTGTPTGGYFSPHYGYISNYALEFGHATTLNAVIQVDWIQIGIYGALDSDAVASKNLSNVPPASVPPALLDVPQLSDVSVDAGTITAGLLQNSGGTAKFDLTNSRIVFDNGTVIKVTGLGFGTSNQFIEWVGLRAGILSGGNPSFALCSESNAIQYITTTGDAYFKGTLNVGTISNSGQTSNTSATASVDIGPFGSNGGGITVNYSLTCGGTALIPSGAPAGVTNYTTSYTIVVERSVNGGAFSQVATQTIAGTQTRTMEDWDQESGTYLTRTISTSVSGSFTLSDTLNTTQDRIYRIRITSRTLGYGTYTGFTQRLALTTQE